MSANQLGSYLKDRRTRLDPAAFGFSSARRRTPGLRREEVAQRANISPTWYTWLEQGRGGAPSVEVLERIAHALMLTDIEREHLFLLAFGRPPEVRYQQNETVTPRLQRVLDALNPSAAILRTATWDVVAWNQAATVMLMDYGSQAPEQRNILRFMFLDPNSRAPNTTGKAWRGLCWGLSGLIRRAQARRSRCSRWWMNCVDAALNLRRCGAKTMFRAPMVIASSGYAIRCWGRSNLSIRCLRSMGARI